MTRSKVYAFRAFSAGLSSTVILLSSLPINANNIDNVVWLSCREDSTVTTLKCDDLNTYKQITNIKQLEKLKNDFLNNKLDNITKLVVPNLQRDYDSFLSYIKSHSVYDIYTSPSLNLGVLDRNEDLNIKKELFEIIKYVKDNPSINESNIYEHPNLKLSEFEKEVLNSKFSSIRRNGYAKSGVAAGAVIVCGIAAVKYRGKITDIVVEKVTSREVIPPLKIEEVKLKVNRKIIPYISDKEDC